MDRSALTAEELKDLIINAGEIYQLEYQALQAEIEELFKGPRNQTEPETIKEITGIKQEITAEASMMLAQKLLGPTRVLTFSPEEIQSLLDKVTDKISGVFDSHAGQDDPVYQSLRQTVEPIVKPLIETIVNSLSSTSISMAQDYFTGWWQWINAVVAEAQSAGMTPQETIKHRECRDSISRRIFPSKNDYLTVWQQRAKGEFDYVMKLIGKTSKKVITESDTQEILDDLQEKRHRAEQLLESYMLKEADRIYGAA